MVFQIARKGWWEILSGIEEGIVKAYIMLLFQNSAEEEISTFAIYHSEKTLFNYVGLLFFSYSLQPSFPSLIIWLHRWFK